MIEAADIAPELTALEKSVLEAALASGEPAAEGFQAQAREARAIARTPSGVGFVTRLQVPRNLFVANSHGGASMPVVRGEHPDLPSGAEFVLQVKDGRLNSIEAFCYEGMWPSDESLFRVTAGS
jgi:hypothetical protein